VSNITRWVQRVDGVAKVKTDLNKGTASVWFKPGRSPKLSKLWGAVKDVGYEATKIESHGKTYRHSKGVTDILSEK